MFILFTCLLTYVCVLFSNKQLCQIIMPFRRAFISLIVVIFWFWINDFGTSNEMKCYSKESLCPWKALGYQFSNTSFLLVLLCYLNPYLSAQCINLQPTALNSSKLVKSSNIRPMSNLLPLIYNLFVYVYRSVFAVVNNHIGQSLCNTFFL